MSRESAKEFLLSLKATKKKLLHHRELERGENA